jgi:cytochrome c553
MTRRKTTWLGLLALCSAVAFAGATASAAAAKKGGGGRDAAIAECVALAKAQNPGQVQAGTAADPGSPGMLAYKSCMQKKGFRP